MTASNTKSYLGYLNKLVDQYNNTYNRPNGKKHIDADYSALTEETEWSHKTPKFKVGSRVTITNYKNVFSKGCTNNWLREKFVIDSVLKANLQVYKIKDVKRETMIGKFYELNL